MANDAGISKTVAKRIEREKQQLLKILPETPIIATACRKAGVSRPTYYRWLEEDPIFSKQVEIALRQGREYMCDMAESVILGKVAEKDFVASKYVLAHNSDRYRPQRTQKMEEERPQQQDYTRDQPTYLQQEMRRVTDKYHRELKEVYISYRKAKKPEPATESQEQSDHVSEENP